MNAVDRFTENIREIKNDVEDVREIRSMTYELDKIIADTMPTESRDDDRSCDTCKHRDKGWYDASCDGCTKAYSNWERWE